MSPTAASSRPLLVLISGAPGSGKTTLARQLGDLFHLPVISRDLIKTGMYVTAARTIPPTDFASPDRRSTCSSTAWICCSPAVRV